MEMFIPIIDCPGLSVAQSEAGSISILAPPIVTVPIALFCTLFLIVYWQLARLHTPRSRRRLRRANAFIFFVLIWILVIALSGFDVDLQPAQFTLAWLGVLGLSVFAVSLATLDIANNFRILKKRDECAQG